MAAAAGAGVRVGKMREEYVAPPLTFTAYLETSVQNTSTAVRGVAPRQCFSITTFPISLMMKRVLIIVTEHEPSRLRAKRSSRTDRYICVKISMI